MSSPARIDGKATAAAITDELKGEVASFVEKTGVTPGLTVVLVGDDPASKVYVGMKEKACAKVGINSVVERVAGDITQEALIARVKELGTDASVHGILVQLPLPKHIDSDAVVQSIAPGKDVDGLTATSVGKLVLGHEDGFVPCTPGGVVELLKRHNISTRGKNVVMVGRSMLVGKPIVSLLSQKGEHADATVTLVHSRTTDADEHMRRADVLIVATGQAQSIAPESVREGVVIIDVGINRIPDATRKSGSRLVGDVHTDTYKKSSHYTPVPGGVGPMTVAMLLRNTLKAAKMCVAE